VALLALPAHAQVFKWTDAQGRTHYGDKPPEDTKTQEVRVPSKSYDGPPQIQDWAAILRRPTNVAGLQPNAASGGLTMFSAVWCGPCKRAKSYLAQKGISYRDVDIDAPQGAREFASFGGGGVPLFISGEKSMRGFSPSGLEALVAPAKR
jgi:glutaredoxin